MAFTNPPEVDRYTQFADDQLVQALVYARAVRSIPGRPRELVDYVLALPNPEPEVIGPPECPLFDRWTLEGGNDGGRKLMLHRFYGNADDRDPHDHPWAFATLVLHGSYTDITADGEEELNAGDVHVRRAKHLHRTRVGPDGAWTLVLTGGYVRKWGFVRDGTWHYWQDYEHRFGFGMRCT